MLGISVLLVDDKADEKVLHYCEYLHIIQRLSSGATQNCSKHQWVFRCCFFVVFLTIFGSKSKKNLLILNISVMLVDDKADEKVLHYCEYRHII